MRLAWHAAAPFMLLKHCQNMAIFTGPHAHVPFGHFKGHGSATMWSIAISGPPLLPLVAMATMKSFGEGYEACLACSSPIHATETLSKYGHFHRSSRSRTFWPLQRPWVGNHVEHCYLRPSIVAIGSYGHNEELWRGL